MGVLSLHIDKINKKIKQSQLASRVFLQHVGLHTHADEDSPAPFDSLMLRLDEAQMLFAYEETAEIKCVDDARSPSI